MNITKNKVNVIINRYETLLQEIEWFVRKDNSAVRHGEIRIDNGNIEEYINTSCHCHPKYEWSHIATIGEFLEWNESKKTSA